MESMVLGSIKKGLKSICFTEHFDPLYPENDDNLDFLLDFDKYETEFQRLKNVYSDRINLYHGVELGVQPHIQKQCEDFYKTYGYRYDFIINSTHLVDGLDPYYGTYFRSFENGKSAIRHYFEQMLENINIFENFQTLAHLDYICRYENDPRTTFVYDDYGDIIDEILLSIIKKNKCLEVNTAGWKYGMEDPNPNRQILSRYRELGGSKITIGSDGHKPDHIAYDFHKLPDFLKSLGFDSYIFHINKKEQVIKL